MVELLIGKTGSGKTKSFIEKVNLVSSVAEGSVVFISPTMSDMYDIKSDVRMCETSQFDIATYNELLFFIKGMISGNYDITNIFIDGIFKIIGTDDLDGAKEFLDSLQRLSMKFEVSIVISMSIDEQDAPDYIKELI